MITLQLRVMAITLSLATTLSVNADAPIDTLQSEITGDNQPTQTFIPPLSTISDDAFGGKVWRGYQLFTNSQSLRASSVGNGMNCTSCHMSSGRLNGAAPLGAAWLSYPAYRKKNNHINSYQERIQGCFLYSMNGLAPKDNAKALIDIAAYSYWIAANSLIGTTSSPSDIPQLTDEQLLKGGKEGFPLPEKYRAQHGDKLPESIPGRGYPSLAKPTQTPDYTRGELVFGESCAICHGSDGLGQKVANGYVFPPLWGKDSFNWGAGMHRINTAANFIYQNMPLGQGQTLSEQQAWDVALYMNAHQRPQDPRYFNHDSDTSKTDSQFHQHQCQYGESHGDTVLGGNNAYPNHPGIDASH